MTDKPAPTRGIPCPKCGCPRHHVDATRQRFGYTVRYRVCEHCGRRFATRETGPGRIIVPESSTHGTIRT